MNLVKNFFGYHIYLINYLSYGSENLFGSVASILACKGYSLPQHDKFHAE